MKIDKSVFDEKELEQFEALIAKAKVNPEAAEEEMEDEKPDVPPKKKKSEKAEVEKMEETKKSAEIEVPEFVKSAIAKSEEFMARVEKQEMAEVAKKYSILGQKPEELGEKLYNLKKSDSAMYETCIALLDSQVAMVEQSGMFAEIGKSASGQSTMGGAEAKANAKAEELMKSDPNLSRVDAIAKAWQDPAIMAEYDAEYNG